MPAVPLLRVKCRLDAGGRLREHGGVYFDRRLWALTAGVRGRIVWTVLVGLAAVAAGIARLALLGWLLGLVLAGRPPGEIAGAVALTAAALVARSALDHARDRKSTRLNSSHS